MRSKASRRTQMEYTRVEIDTSELPNSRPEFDWEMITLRTQPYVVQCRVISAGSFIPYKAIGATIQQQVPGVRTLKRRQVPLAEDAAEELATIGMRPQEFIMGFSSADAAENAFENGLLYAVDVHAAMARVALLETRVDLTLQC